MRVGYRLSRKRLHPERSSAAKRLLPRLEALGNSGYSFSCTKERLRAAMPHSDDTIVSLQPERRSVLLPAGRGVLTNTTVRV